MAFERLEVRAASGKKGMPASMSLSSHGGSSRPAAIVALSAALVGEAGYSSKSKFNIFIGMDDDQGKLRIVAEKDGILEPRLLKSGAYFLNLGYVPVIGIEACKKKPTEAKVISPGTVELIIPDFSQDRRRLLAPPPASKTAENRTKANGAAGTEHFNGVTIDFAESEESVSFKGKSTEVSTRQAKLIRLLARPRPAPVAESFLIAGLWDGRPPANAKEQLKTMAGDLQKGLSPIGLNLCLVKGVGYQLKDR
jgi:hypothetical protein